MPMKGIWIHCYRTFIRFLHRNSITGTIVIPIFIKFKRLIYKKRLQASQELVTEFSAFILSNYYLSDEIDGQGLVWLNPESKRLYPSKFNVIESCSVIFCQVDQLADFAHHILPRIDVDFILISGKSQLPGLVKSKYVEDILRHENLLVWYSQNQVFEELAILPFPYGLNFKSAPSVLARMRKGPFVKVDGLLVPFVGTHAHLQGPARADRETLGSSMATFKPLEYYLEEISSHTWIVSPAGDRPDTYRHWEIIALGGVIVSNLPPMFKSLFGDAICLVPNYEKISNFEITGNLSPNPSMATLEYWRKQISIFKSSS